MNSRGLVQIGFYGTRYVLKVGETELFMVKRVDLQRSFIRLQRWDSDYIPACDFSAPDKPWFKPNEFGIIARNGCLAKIRQTFSADQIRTLFATQIDPSFDTSKGLLTEAFGRPAFIAGGQGFVMGSVNHTLSPSSIKRNYALTIDPVRLSKFSYIIHPSIPELLEILGEHAGILCDPFALQAGKKQHSRNQFVHVPLK